MRRHLLTAALTGVFGLALMAADASACCHKRACATPCPPPCPPPVVVCAPAPCPPPACAPAKKCCGHKLRGLFAGHKCRPAC